MTQLMTQRASLPVMLGLLLLVTLLAAPAFGANALQGDSAFEKINVTATGAAGAATGTVTTSTRFWGYLKAIYIDYGAISDTTDITISTITPPGTVMVKTDSMTDSWFYPSVQFTGATGAAVSGAYGKFPVADYLTIRAAESTSGTVATIWIYYGQ